MWINKKMMTILAILMILVFSYSLLEPYWIEIKKVDIMSSDIPPSFDSTKIVFLTDIHHGPFFSKDRLKKLVLLVNNLKPDIVLLGGDYVHREPKYIESCFEELKNLKAPYGKYGVLGNHDHWEGAELTKVNAENAGIELLDNNAKWIHKGGEQIKIGGVGDMFEDIQNIEPTVNDVEQNDFVILLSHNPDYVETIKTKSIDLVLSGHTHGGQVTLFGLWAPIVPIKNKQKYRTGIVDTPFTKVIISNGIGTITPPLRFFARPQIYVINLRQAQRDNL